MKPADVSQLKFIFISFAVVGSENELVCARVRSGDPEDNLQNGSLPLPRAFWGLARLGSRYLYPLNYLSSPTTKIES